MNRKTKLLALLALVCVLLTSVLVACSHEHTFEETWSNDATHHWHAATCKHTDEVSAKGPHLDETNDGLCDTCGYKCGEHIHTFSSEWTTDNDGHWHAATCEHTSEKDGFAVHTDTNADDKCDTCQMSLIESVTYALNISDLTKGTLSADEIRGKFTIVSGTEIRNRTKTFDGVEYNKSVKIGNKTAQIKVSVPGEGKLSFLVQNGSDSATTQFITVTAPDGTKQDIEFDGTNNGSPVVKIELDVTAGEWIISRGKNGGTQDVFYLELTCTVKISPEVGFELVTAGKTDYLIGETFDNSRLQLNAVFQSGKTNALDLAKVSIDTSKVDMTKEGVYDVTLSYKSYDPITYKVKVYDPKSIELGFDAIEKLGSNTSAGNGVYFNHSFRELYSIGDELDKAGLTVIVVAKCGDDQLEFIVDDYKVTGFDSTSIGEKVLTISANGVSATTSVHVTDTVPTANEEGVIGVLVDPNYLGLRGAVSGVYNVFSTIQQALDFLQNADATVQKELNIAPGYYWEKLEITIPNLHIIGCGEKADDVVIEWDSLYGLKDASGFTHTTDSTQTVAVREQAVNCVIEGVTISNYWNSQARLDEEGHKIERNLALLVQGDRFIMRDSRLLGIQDTLELFTGRQLFENVFISGYTDFICGTNSTTYFKNCTIHVIDTGKDDSGTAGYITAMKGSNKGAADSVLYGVIFDGCNFTADEGVMEGKTAIGRTWAAYAAVAVINSELGEHISVDGYDPANNKNKRYISMSGVHPTAETVKFVEYNNTGAGAITEAVAGMTMLTAEQAANYADFAVIFGTTNGNVSYLDPWNPESTEVVEDDRIYYYFNGQGGTSGTWYTYDQNLNGVTGTFGDIAIDATAGKVTARESDTQMNSGAKLTFSVEAGTTVTVISYPGYGHYTLNGVAHNANEMFSQHYAEATEVEMVATATAYIYQIIINPNEEAPEAPTIKELQVEGMKVDYLVGEELSLEGISVNAIYSDHSLRPVEYTVDASAVDNTTAGEYTVVFTSGENKVEVQVFFVADLTISESTTIDLTATGANIEKAVGTYKCLTIDATNGKFVDNGNNWVQVNTGTIITFKYSGEVNVSVTAYTSADNFDIVTADGLCTITALANDYLSAIAVEIVKVYSESTTIDLSATGAKIEGSKGVYEGLNIDATSGKFADNGSGWVQVNAGTIITLNVADGAQVSVTPHGSADNFEIVIANGVCTITVKTNDYLKAISIVYPVVYDKATTIDLSATGAKIEGGKGVYEGLNIDATSGKFADNGSGWVQVNAGTIITLNVADGAQVSVTANGSADNFEIVITDGVCTITVKTNDYLKAIAIAY